MDYGAMPEGGGKGKGPWLTMNKTNFPGNEWMGPYKFIKGRLIPNKQIPEKAYGKFWQEDFDKGRNLYQMRVEVKDHEVKEDEEYKGHLIQVAQTSGVGRAFFEAKVQEGEEFEIRRVPEGRKVEYKDESGKEISRLADLWEIRKTGEETEEEDDSESEESEKPAPKKKTVKKAVKKTTKKEEPEDEETKIEDMDVEI